MVTHGSAAGSPSFATETLSAEDDAALIEGRAPPVGLTTFSGDLPFETAAAKQWIAPPVPVVGV